MARFLCCRRAKLKLYTWPTRCPMCRRTKYAVAATEDVRLTGQLNALKGALGDSDATQLVEMVNVVSGRRRALDQVTYLQGFGDASRAGHG